MAVRSFQRFSHFFAIFRSSMAIVTALLFFTVQIAPAKRHLIHPSPYTTVHAYADNVEKAGNSTVTWLDRDTYTYECDIKEGLDWRYCGLSLKFFDDPVGDNIITRNGDFGYDLLRYHNLSAYQSLELELDYTGSENAIRIYMRDAFNMPKGFAEHNSQKFLTETLNKGEMTHTVKVMLNEFSVADWWMAQFQKPRQDGVATFNKIFEIGVDFPGQPPLGKHLFSVRKVTAVGEYVNKETLYFGIIVFWMCMGIAEGSIRLLYRFRYMSNENIDLREKAQTDALTGLINRHGIMPIMEDTFPVGTHESLYLLVIDLDHFKQVNDQFGHDVGDTALVRVATALQAGLRDGDILGRWGGEEFLIMCKIPAVNLESFIKRLQKEIENVIITTGNGDLRLTMSIGVARAHAGESFEKTFKRADTAVYDAKAAGRNTWIYRD